MRKKSFLLIAVVFLLVLLSSVPWNALTHAQETDSTQMPTSPSPQNSPLDLSPLAHTETKLTEPAPANSQYFGDAVDIYGNYAIVGTRQEKALIYQLIGGSWTHVQTLSNAGSAMNFGQAVAINNSYAIVGADFDVDGTGTRTGAIYVYERQGNIWNPMPKVTPANGDQDDLFGQAVAISGAYIAVGAPGDDNTAQDDRGAVYVYTRLGNAWVPLPKVTVPNSTEQQFGRSVDINGNRIVAGNSSEAYVVEHEQHVWDQPIPLTPPGNVDGNYGISVAISGDFAVVGSPTDDQVAANAGAAFVFHLSNENWDFDTKLIALDTADTDHFGQSVAMDGRYMIIGADDDDNERGQDAGTAYIFREENGSWIERSKFTASDGLVDDLLGSAVAVSNYHVVAGAPYANVADFSNAGAAYVYALDFAPTVNVIVNNQAETAVVPASTPTTFVASLDPGTRTGQQAEWWVGLATPVGTIWKNANGWTPSITPIMLTQSPLPAMWSLNLPLNLPASTYTLFVVLDENLNGAMDATWSGSATAVVLPAAANPDSSGNLTDLLLQLERAAQK